MKKILALSTALVLFVFCFSGCSKNISNKPKDTNLEFWITDDVSDFDFTNYYSIPGWFGACEYYGCEYEPLDFDAENLPIEPEHCVKYKVTSYPDYSSKAQHITSIVITDPTITFFGITLESADDEIKNTMTKNGYTYIPVEEFCLSGKNTFNRSYVDCLYFKQGNITFVFYENEIRIQAEITNKFGIQF